MPEDSWKSFQEREDLLFYICRESEGSVHDQGLIRITRQMRRLLAALLIKGGARFDGYDLMKRAHLKSGTLYPALRRLEDLGWVESAWEASEETSGPRRRYYTLTPRGFTILSSMRAELDAELAEASSSEESTEKRGRRWRPIPDPSPEGAIS